MKFETLLDSISGASFTLQLRRKGFEELDVRVPDGVNIRKETKKLLKMALSEKMYEIAMESSVSKLKIESDRGGHENRLIVEIRETADPILNVTRVKDVDVSGCCDAHWMEENSGYAIPWNMLQQFENDVVQAVIIDFPSSEAVLYGNITVMFKDGEFLKNAKHHAILDEVAVPEVLKREEITNVTEFCVRYKTEKSTAETILKFKAKEEHEVADYRLLKTKIGVKDVWDIINPESYPLTFDERQALITYLSYESRTAEQLAKDMAWYMRGLSAEDVLKRRWALNGVLEDA